MTGTAVRHEADEMLLGFARALRVAGLPVTHDRATAWLEAASIVGVQHRQAVYWAGRATLCSGPDDLPRYDQVFEAWFLDPQGLPRPATPPERTRSIERPLPEDDTPGEDPAAGEALAARASEEEVLRHRDVADLSARERVLLHQMVDRLHPRVPWRAARRRTPRRRGDLDASRTLRATLRQMGEPAELAWRHQSERPRRVVLLVDVSGSMSGYADALLRVAHRYVVTLPAVEVFTLGTRLTRVTRALRTRDPERALVAAGETVPDWAGGTRLGETLKAFLDRWGRRGVARGAVVVVFSDGWERGGADLLGEQLDALARVAHSVVWVNPHRGKAGYEPLQSGIVAALPHVDHFLAGHSLATFEELVEVVEHA